MGSKPTGDGDSPSASSFFLPLPQLPQLRHSRRGSLASLSSANQLDKETLSQALDQIHSTASQTETLTTFNEYTSPPPSSSGPESKGIASELHGGLSGLYSRLRASVGNVKEIVNIGGEDGNGEESSLKSPRIQALTSPSSSRHTVESARLSSSSVAVPAVAASGSGRESPLGDISRSDDVVESPTGRLKSSRATLGSASASSKSTTGNATLRSPSITLTQAAHPNVIGPTLAEVNVTAIKRSDLTAGLVSNNGKAVESGSQTPRQSSKPKDGNDSSSRETVEPRRDASEKRLPLAYPDRSTIATERFDEIVGKQHRGDPTTRPSTESVSHLPGLGADEIDDVASAVKNIPAENKEKTNRLPLIVTNQLSNKDDVFRATGGSILKDQGFNERSRLAANQRLELPVRKSLAAPIISRSHSPNLSISRPSSSESNVDSILFASPNGSTLPGHANPVDQPRIKHSVPKPIGSTSTHRDSRTMNVFSQVKNKVLNKEYWMKDENAKDCFYCGESFSTFRRKHHCRTCGQIFDAKCTSILSGEHFGQTGTLRVCKPCEGIINGENDSSELSDDGSLSVSGRRPRHGSTGASDVLASPAPSSNFTETRDPHRKIKSPELTIPTMSIPATRKARSESGRKATVLEIDAEQALVRPTSSRSVKSSFANKPHQPGHRRYNSRHQIQRGPKSVNDESAPFHQNPIEVKDRPGRLPAFHEDNIIDPDLAPYLSDEGSSGDEQMSIMGALNSSNLSRSHDNDKQGFTYLLGSAKKARSRAGDKIVNGVTVTGRDIDDNSLNSRSANPPRASKRRNLSVTGNVHMRPSPRSYRASVAIPNFSSGLNEGTSSSALAQAVSADTAGASRMIRSSSMRGAAAPAIELNNASLRHVRRLLNQLLQDSNMPGIASWQKALMPILLRATDDVNPNVQNGDDIDIRHYVKLKKIPGGQPGDTAYVSGLVFTKNLALKCMPRSISHPNILILTFPLEYARHQQHFMSLEPVIRQEREFLQNLVNRIAALRPHLLLVERNISGLALEFLEQANIATAYNVKASVLEAVSRCCQTKIISSIDKLAIRPAQAGKCASFYLKTYVNGGRKKTYTFLDGCAKELGCTIVLRGANDTTLAKMKRICEFMIYVVYNLKLETCLMRDEFALIPSTTEIGSMSLGKDHAQSSLRGLFADSKGSKKTETPTKTGSESRGNATSQSHTEEPNVKKLEGKKSDDVLDEDSLPDDVPMPTYYTDMVEEHKTKILSASPFVKFMQPYLLKRAREQERRLAYLKRLRDQDISEEQVVDEKLKPEKFDLIKPEMVHERVETASRKVREVLHAVHDAEYDKALYSYQTQTKQWESYISGNINLLDPYTHQNIAVLYSLVCTVTTTPCSGPDILALGFYSEHETDTDFEADCTLGQYVEDLCLGAHAICTANGCEKKMFEHHRQYVHGEAQLSVFVEPYPCKLRGLQDVILMWSTCRICGKETQVLPMSESTWKYSFGKYLELSFWSTELRARADVCPHDLHRNHLRYFGFKDLALRIHYDPITLLEIIVPRPRITWKVDNDLRFKNELFGKIEDRLTKFMSSVKARIRSINTDSVIPEKIDHCKQEVDRLSKRASDDHHAIIQRLRKNYMNSKHYEVVPLNRAIRATQEKVSEWDSEFADFDRNFFPSEKDIRRLATFQLRKIFLERDESITSLTSTEDGTVPSIPEESLSERNSPDQTPSLAPQTRQMSPEKAHDMLASVVEKHVSTDGEPEQHQSAPATAVPIVAAEPQMTRTGAQETERQDVRHLDLAVSSDLAETVPGVGRASANGAQASNLEGDGQKTKGKIQEVESPHSPVDFAAMRSEREMPMEDLSSGLPKLVERSHVSSIPRPIEGNQRGTRSNISPTLSRAQSQPAHMRNEKTNSSHPSISSALPQPSGSSRDATDVAAVPLMSSTSGVKPTDKKMLDRFSLSALKASSVSAHSMIPRSIASRRRDTKVSSLAKHFEQLSREFEKERIRERRQRAAKRQSRAYPMATSKPIVQIYRNVREAVEEKDPSDEDLLSSDPSQKDKEESLNTSTAMTEHQSSRISDEAPHAEETTAENTDTEDNTNLNSYVGSDVEGEGVRSDEDHSTLDDIQSPSTADEHHALSPDEAQLEIKLDLPKHEKSSLMKMLTNFWAERSASGWKALDYPLNATDHVFADSDIIVREDEPSSLIAFALDSKDYRAKLSSISETYRHSTVEGDKGPPQGAEATLDEGELEQSLLRATGTHVKYQFSEGSAKMLCKVFYAEQFDAVRRKCGVSERIVESLSRCAKWDSKGGKTKSIFLKTLDDRFILKSLSQIETQAFLRFAPAYFRIMSESLFHQMPSVIAKMLGFYQIIIKNPATGGEFNWFMLVMENLFYDRSCKRVFDLKGSMRNRRIQSTGEQNEVLLDENMVEFIYESPLFTREHSKRLLRGSVWNDTLFLAGQNVMDYSLMVAIDEERKELVVGIIDCIRTYTWDKKLETWIKDRGKNKPTVMSPKVYKSRFREAMGRYILQAPNCWHHYHAQEAISRSTRTDDPGDDRKVRVGDF